MHFITNRLKSPTARQSLGNLTIKVFEALLKYVAILLITRIAGPEGYGNYSYYLSWVTILVICVTLGFDRLLVREVARNMAIRNFPLAQNIIKFSFKFVAINSIVTLGIIWLVLWFFKVELLYNYDFLIASLALPLFSLVKIRQGVLQGLKKTVYGNLPERVVRPTIFILSMITSHLIFGFDLNTTVILTCFTFSFVLAFIIGSIVLNIQKPAELSGHLVKYSSKEWIKLALPFTLITGMRLIHSNTDILVIGSLLSKKEVGLYATGLKVSEIVQFIYASISTAASPVIASSYAKNDKAKLQRTVIMAAHAILAISLPAIILMLVFGDRILTLFGSEFDKSIGVLYILVLGQVVNAITGCVTVALTMCNETRSVSKGLFLSAIVNLILNFILVPHFGIEGAAWSTAISLALWNISLVYFANKRLNLKVTAFNSWTR